MTIITLTSDFGESDGFTGVMKGVIWGIAPQAHIADITHAIPPQNISQAALVLDRSVPFFPAGTIHVVVVDPGVGTGRRPLVAKIGSQFYVGPDNGTITRWLERAQKQGENTLFIHLNRPEFRLLQVSNVFHGRDIFAPAAAHLVNGTPLEALGDPIQEPVRLVLPRPQAVAGGWRAEIIQIDHFGNLTANLNAEHLSGQVVRSVHIRNATIAGLVQAFGERAQGELVALINSSSNLEIARVNGSAASFLGAVIGDPIQVETIADHGD